MAMIAGMVLLLVWLPGAAQNLQQMQEKALRFYGYQRAGLRNGNPHNPYYAGLHLSEYPHAYDADGNNPLDGGWYDAGDFMKFGLPLGYTVYALLKGYDVFPNGYDDHTSWNYGPSNGIPDVLDEAKVGTDYLCRAVISDTRVIMDVGNPHSDHGDVFESGVDNSNRTRHDRLNAVRAADGADVPGLYAAALALMSQLYRPYDAAYADQCLAKARQAFSCGIRQRDRGNSTPTGTYYSYPNPTWVDKLMAGAIELYRATGEAVYRGWIEELQGGLTLYHGALGYTSVAPLVSFEMYRLGLDNTASLLVNNVNWCLNRVRTSPASLQGAFVNVSWGTARDAAAAAFTAGLAYLVTGNEGYHTFAQNQIRWVSGTLGHSNQSYMIGFGTPSPRHPHHRNALAYGRLPEGGVVAGPDDNGNWQDDHNLYEYTEVAIDYNAALVGALGFLREVASPPPGSVQIQTALSSSSERVDFNDGSVTLTATFSASVPWKLELRGATSSAVAVFEGSAQQLRVVWDGTGDQGTFLSGEMVRARLVMDAIVSYHLSRSQVDFFIARTRQEPFRPADVLVASFDGDDSTNALGGRWETFSDAEQGGQSYTVPGTFSASALTTQGEGGTNGMRVRMVGREGFAHPYAGVRTTFNREGSAVSIGEASSIVFDVRGTAADTFSVELEQETATGRIPFGTVVTLGGNEWTRLRIMVDNMTPPAAAGGTVLNRGSMVALRFTYYGVSNVAPVFDNIHVEHLAISASGIVAAGCSAGPGGRLVFTRAGGGMVLRTPVRGAHPQRYELLTPAGEIVARGVVAAGGEGERHLATPSLRSGMYLLRFPAAPGGSAGYPGTYRVLVTR